MSDARRRKRARGNEQHSHGTEHDGLFVVESLQKRQDHAGTQQPHGEVPGSIEPAIKAVREHEQSDSHGAAEQVRELQDRQGHEPAQQLQAMADAGGRPRQEQHGTRGEYRDGARLRRHRAEPCPAELTEAHHRSAVHPELMRAQ